MTSPHHLHATAAAWATRAATRRLAQLAALEARQTVHAALAAAPGLRSPTYGTRHGVGDHADPTLTTLTAAPVRLVQWADLLRRADDRLTWIAGHVAGRRAEAAAGMDPVDRILTVLPKLQPGTAAIVGEHLADENTWIRDAVRMPPSGALLPGVPCPRCGVRQLQVHTEGPESAWTVTCSCRCVGQGCRCGMPGAVEGVAHIWPRYGVLGAVR